MVALPVEMNSKCNENKTQESKCEWVKGKVVEVAKMILKIGKDDPRRIVHSMKVGLAITLVSLFYYFRPLYDSFQEAGMWALLTVVVVFEYTVGGTLSKSLNRGAATLVAAALGVGAKYLSDLGGEKGEPVILGFLVFIIATASTFTRFFPMVKSKYDYGVMIFILTFSLIAVSGYRVTQIIQLAHQRLATVLIGGATCIIISIFVFPVWAGQDLHSLMAGNIEKLATFLDGFGAEFFSLPVDGAKFGYKEDDKGFLLSYKSVLNSKATEESLAKFAWWEPGHGLFKFRQPLNQYLKMGIRIRECATKIDVLGGYFNSKPEVAIEFYKKIEEPCTRMSKESGKALKELSFTMKNMTSPSPVIPTHIQNSKAAAEDLKIILKSISLILANSELIDLQDIMRPFVVASTLISIINCVDKIYLSVNELSQKAHFKEPVSITYDSNNDIAGAKDRVMIDILGPSAM